MHHVFVVGRDEMLTRPTGACAFRLQVLIKQASGVLHLVSLYLYKPLVKESPAKENDAKSSK